MPARQPFTSLCQSAAQNRRAGWIDLHVHSTASDGACTPKQLVNLATRTGLAGMALTDHDTMDGLAAARDAARDSSLEIVAGVEITAEHDGREIHLLGYFLRADDKPLRAALRRLGEHRTGRFWEMVERLKSCGVALDRDEVAQHAGTGTLGRRRLAEYLVQVRRASTVHDAFKRYLGDRTRACVPKLRLPVAEAVALVRGAGGVAAWAHPSYDATRDTLIELKAVGLLALEAHYPSFRPARVRELKELAHEVGLAVTGGSDYHGPDRPRRALGCCGISQEELEAVRSRAVC